MEGPIEITFDGMILFLTLYLCSGISTLKTDSIVAVMFGDKLLKKEPTERIETRITF